MIPPINTLANTALLQAPLINTALPGSTVTHVPYDNVSPSVSNAQVENNSTSNGNIPAAAQQEAAAASDAQASEAFFATLNGTQQSQNAGVQATFLAQLLAQDGSPEMHIILVQYEKLVALANVKYKPSNAGKPPEPSNIFGQILHQEQPVQAVPLSEAIAPPPSAAPVAMAMPIYVPPAPRAADAYAASETRNASIGVSAAMEIA